MGLRTYTAWEAEVSTGQPSPRLTTDAARYGVGSRVQVPLSGVATSLLRRLGRMLNALPKSTGPDSFSLGCAPLPNGGLRNDGLMNETPASSAAGASLQRGPNPEFNLISQTTSSRENPTTVSRLTFSVRREACLADNFESAACRESGRKLRLSA